MTEEWATKRAERIQRAYEAFKEHKATLECGAAGIQVLNWQKPGTLRYRVRYVFDTSANRIYIGGDLGAAVVHPTWKATFENTYRNTAEGRTDTDVDEGYFLSNVEATSNRYVFDRDAAERCVRENCEGIEAEEGAVKAIMRDFDEDWGLKHVGEKARNLLSDYDPDFWEWLRIAGRSVDGRVYLWLVGLKLAWRQLHKESADGQQ